MINLALNTSFILSLIITQIKYLSPRRRTISAFATKLVPDSTGFLYLIFPTSAEQRVEPNN